MVVHLDVKKAFGHVKHRAAFRAMKLQGVSLFSNGSDCGDLEWKLLGSTVGSSLVVQSSR